MGAGAGAAAAEAATTGGGAHELAFVDVESAEAVYALLRPWEGEVALAWSAWDDARRTRPTAGVATFTSKRALEGARSCVGGGLRGAYRVVQPASRPA